MFLSKNGTALFIFLVEALLSALGVEFEPGSVTHAVEGVLIAVSLILMAWHQFERSDSYKLFFKK